MYVDTFRSRVEALRAMTCVVRITKKFPWGHEPGLVAIRFFDWQTAKKLRKEFIESYEDYLENDSEVLGDAFAFLFFDAARQTETACPVLMATTDSFKLREVAPSLEELGVICVAPAWAPKSLVVLE